MAVGVTLHDVRQYKAQLRADATVAFGFTGNYPSVLTVASGSPAALAGVRPNDALKAVNGVPLGIADQAEAQSEGDASYDSVEKAMRVLETLPPETVILQLERGGKPIEVSLQPQPACPSRVELVPSSELNGSANGEVAQVYGALVNWVRNDDELALVIAHEVAHNVLRHDARISKEKINTGIFAGLGKSGRKLRDMEREADRLGTWMAARGGFDYRLAPHFWRRLTGRSGIGAVWATTHPTAGSRADALVPVVRQIDAELSGRQQSSGPAALVASPDLASSESVKP